MKLTQKIRAQADKTITIKDVSELVDHGFKNMALALATAMIKRQGWYSCVIDERRVLVVLR